MKNFKLSDKFIEEFKGQQPNWGFGALSYITYKRSYSRKKNNGSSEEFWETLRRVVEGVFSIQKKHCAQYLLFWDNRKAQNSAQIMYRMMWEFKFLPPGRGLWGMGTDALESKGAAMLNNCGFASTQNIQVDLATPFCWSMDMLMLGVGVGFDTRGTGTVLIKAPAPNTGEKYEIPDTREGWIEALRVVLGAFQRGSAIPKFDYSLIRPKGTPIKTFGGTASGPQPLIDMIEDITKILSESIDEYISTANIVDIMNLIGRCVVSGNVRRSAELALCDPDDPDFLSLKDPEKYPDQVAGWRWASNNSIMAILGMNYAKSSKETAKNGEPGYTWLQNARMYGRMKDKPDNKDYRAMGFNPCVEQVLEDLELCNLVELFPAHHETIEEFYETIKYAYMYAKTVTLVPSHDPRTNAVMIRNRRIGTSMSGIEQAKKKFGAYRFYTEFCDGGYQILKDYDRIYSEWLGIARSNRVSSVKPSGTLSILVGATSGVHASHSEYYWRLIRIQDDSPLISLLIKAGYRIEYEASNWNRKYGIKKSDWEDYVLCNKNAITSINREEWSLPNYSGALVVYFPIKEKNFTKPKHKQSIWEQTENAAKMQEFWSDNSVSVTITFNEDEADQLEAVLDHYQYRLKAASFLPLMDHKYVQAPFITITANEYEDALECIQPLDIVKQIGPDDKHIEAYCEGDKCNLKRI